MVPGSEQPTGATSAGLARAPRPILVVIGPSGSGKSALVRALAAANVVTVTPTWTTRPRRADEHAGSVEHRFVSTAEFAQRQRAGEFVETVQMFGLPHWYGLPAVVPSGDGHVSAVMLRAPLIARFAQHYDNFLVYQVEAPSDVIAARLVARGYDATELDARLADNERERDAGRVIADRTFDNTGALGALVHAVTIALRHDATPQLLEHR